MWSPALVVLLVAWTSALDIKQMREILMADKDLQAARDVCMQKLGLSPEEVSPDKLGNIKDETDKMLCFAKCIQEEQGYLDGDGNLVMDAVKKLPIMGVVTEEQRSQIGACLKEIGSIKECQDIKKERECIMSIMN